MNEQLGLNNIKDISSTITVLAKAELPTKTFLGMNQRLRAGPVMTFSDKKAFFFAGISHCHPSICPLTKAPSKYTYQTSLMSTESD